MLLGLITEPDFLKGQYDLGVKLDNKQLCWIFWKRGLLIVILSHILQDLVFHVIGTPYS